jgi:SnoaL-like domain
MKTTDELVRELLDREAIRDLAINYCDCLYRNDLEALVSLFTENGIFAAKDPDNEVATHGRAELRHMYETVAGQLHPRPYIHTHVVKLRSVNSATGKCYVEMRSAKVAMTWMGSGYYEDDYAKVGEEWKFARRRLVEMDMAITLRTFKMI